MRYAKPFLIGASLLMLLRLLLHAYLARYAVPVADDLCYAANAPGMPLLRWLANEYQHWNGRYASNLLVGRGPLQWGDHGLTYYQLVPVALLLATLGALYAFVRAILPRSGRGVSAFVATALLLLYLDLMPDIGQGIYWYTGAITYQLGSIVLLLCAVQFIRWHEATIRRGTTTVLLLVLTIGMSETHMVLAVLWSIAAIAFDQRRRRLWPYAAIALLCAAVVIAAPGNAERSAFFPEKHALLHSLGMTAAQTARFLAIWLFSPALITASIAFAVFHPLLREHLPPTERSWLHRPVIVAALLLATIAACVFPAYWSMGMLAQHRTLNVACFFFLPLWFWLLHLCLERWPIRYQWTRPIRMAGPVLGSVALLFTGNGWHAIADLCTGRAETFAREMAEPMDRRTITATPRTLCVLLPDGPEDEWMVVCERDYERQRSQRGTEADEAVREALPR